MCLFVEPYHLMEVRFQLFETEFWRDVSEYPFSCLQVKISVVIKLLFTEVLTSPLGLNKKLIHWPENLHYICMVSRLVPLKFPTKQLSLQFSADTFKLSLEPSSPRSLFLQHSKLFRQFPEFKVLYKCICQGKTFWYWLCCSYSRERNIHMCYLILVSLIITCFFSQNANTWFATCS